MKKLVLFTCLINTLLLFPGNLYAQNDSENNLKDTVVLKKGFYKTYQEFLNNSPSILLNFSVKLFTAGGGNQTSVRAEYTIIDSSDMFGEFWGFCDGENIFVPYGGFFELKYWKLQCKGPNPFFYYRRKPVLPGLLLTPISLALPASYELMFIDKNGKPQNYWNYDVKNLLRDNKPLLKEYKKEISHTPDIVIAYIVRYNEAKLKQ